MCLSTTKWIHLNWGDDGIRRLFQKVYSMLRLRGYFILEPQNWKSYKKKKYFCDDFKKVY
jgi:7SK snRNA methylphosphate capping enzyme